MGNRSCTDFFVLLRFHVRAACMWMSPVHAADVEINHCSVSPCFVFWHDRCTSQPYDHDLVVPLFPMCLCAPACMLAYSATHTHFVPDLMKVSSCMSLEIRLMLHEG